MKASNTKLNVLKQLAAVVLSQKLPCFMIRPTKRSNLNHDITNRKLDLLVTWSTIQTWAKRTPDIIVEYTKNYCWVCLVSLSLKSFFYQNILTIVFNFLIRCWPLKFMMKQLLSESYKYLLTSQILDIICGFTNTK